MAAIHLEPFSSLVLHLARASGARDFVETGTYLGDTLGWAARHFERVWTVEIDATYLGNARERYRQQTNIAYFLGDSATELPGICERLGGPAVFWLDAHAGAGFFAPEDRCPLVAELQCVVKSRFEPLVFVDDARAFVAPPPPPFNYRTWPSLDEIFAVLSARSDYHAVIILDALIWVPRRYRAAIAEFCFRARPQI